MEEIKIETKIKRRSIVEPEDKKDENVKEGSRKNKLNCQNGWSQANLNQDFPKYIILPAFGFI